MTHVPVLIEGARLRLRRARPADAASLFALVDDTEVMRYMDWPRAASEAETRRHLEGAEQRWAAGSEHQYLVVLKADERVVGSIAFRPHGFAADFGYLVGRAHWGRGYATEAAQLLLGWLQRQGHLRVWATCDADNAASAAVLRKAGLQFEGRLRRATLRPQLGPAPRDTLMFAWVRDDAPSPPAENTP
jgi:[ribosomal protein S5]-alanine N-acetyltransferase